MRRLRETSALLEVVESPQWLKVCEVAGHGSIFRLSQIKPAKRLNVVDVPLSLIAPRHLAFHQRLEMRHKL